LDKVVASYQAGTQILISYDRGGQSFDTMAVLTGFK